MKILTKFSHEFVDDEGKVFINTLETTALTKNELIGAFEQFMKGAGFNLVGSIEDVPQEDWSTDEGPTGE